MGKKKKKSSEKQRQKKEAYNAIKAMEIADIWINAAVSVLEQWRDFNEQNRSDKTIKGC